MKRKNIYSCIIIAMLSCCKSFSQTNEYLNIDSLKGTWGLTNYFDTIVSNKELAKYRMQPPTWFAILIKMDTDSLDCLTYLFKKENIESININDWRYEIHLNDKGKKVTDSIDFSKIHSVRIETSNEEIYILPFGMSLRPDDIHTYRNEDGSIFNSGSIFFFMANHLSDKKRIRKFKSDFKMLNMITTPFNNIKQQYNKEQLMKSTSKKDSLYLISNIYTNDKYYIIEAIRNDKIYKILSSKPLIQSSNSSKSEIKSNNYYQLNLNKIFPPENIPFTEAINIKTPIEGEKEVFEAKNLYGLFLLLDD